MLDNLKNIINAASEDFRNLMSDVLHQGGMKKEMYVRYLQMQYHLTKNVQKHFFAIASHPEMEFRRKLQKFLLDFGLEEQPHYLIAEQDLKNLDESVGESPFDVRLWWSYFNGLIEETPLVRLGGTAILENISDRSKDVLDALFASASFLTPKNTRFLILHRHETLPHGDQILKAIEEANLTDNQLSQIIQGAKEARILYMRMANWAITGESKV